jgi:hypothetical protein
MRPLSGALHLTGICQLAQHLTQDNYETLVGRARGKTKRQIEELVAAVFPRPDVPERICPVPQQTTALSLVGPAGEIRPGTDPARAPSKPPTLVQPLSESR